MKSILVNKLRKTLTRVSLPLVQTTFRSRRNPSRAIIFSVFDHQDVECSNSIRRKIFRIFSNHFVRVRVRASTSHHTPRDISSSARLSRITSSNIRFWNSFFEELLNGILLSFYQLSENPLFLSQKFAPPTLSDCFKSHGQFSFIFSI